MLKAVAHPERLAIVQYLSGAHQYSVTDIFTELGMDQAVASHHLKILRSKQIIECQRDGKHMMYQLKNEMFADLLKNMCNCLN